MMTLEQRTKLVQGAIYRIGAHDAIQIAKACNAAEAAGENFSAWHQASIYFKTLDRCQCVACVKTRTEVAHG